jgi:hypothetical protein
VSNLRYRQKNVSCTLVVALQRQHCEGNVELVIVIVVALVAGAMIPGNPRIRFFR